MAAGYIYISIAIHGYKVAGVLNAFGQSAYTASLVELF